MYKKNIYLWLLYDFANSIVYIAFFLYFSQWIVVDAGLPDLYFNFSFVVASLALFLSAPIAGFFLDKHWRRITGLRWTTVAIFVFYSLTSFFAINNHPLSALIFFSLGLYFYLLSFSFYNPLIQTLATPDTIGKISGLGICANYLGHISGLFLTLLFASAKISFFGAPPRVETLLPATVCFFLFALPAIIFFREDKKAKQKIKFQEALLGCFKETRTLFSFKQISIFILAFFIYSNATSTIVNNLPIYLDKVWHLDDMAKNYLILGILIMSAAGAFASGFIADKIGHKRTLKFILGGWLIILPTAAITSNFYFYLTLAVLIGLFNGSLMAVSRSVLARLAPLEQTNLAFSYYSIIERSSSIFGPIVWGLCIALPFIEGTINYRIATVVMAVVIGLGLGQFNRLNKKYAPSCA